MSRREAWGSAALVAVVAIAVRAWAAAIITFPRPEDTAYYVGVARHLLAGDGLVSNAIWSYGTPPLQFPRPAFEVWLPLPTFLDAIPMWLLGPAFRAAQWASIVEGALVAVLAWRLAADVGIARALPPGRARTLALGTGLTSAVYLPLVLHSVLPDSTMPFAALVLAVCLLAGRVARSRWGDRQASDPRVLALGLGLGLAALTRNEAIWLALAWVIVARGIGGRSWLRLVAGAALPAVIVFLPWAIRDWLTFGSPLPGQALANALSLNGTDIFAWQSPPTLASYLGAGLGTLLGLRWDGFLHNLGDVLLLPGVPIAAIGLVSLPFALGGRWPTRVGRAPLPPEPVPVRPEPGPALRLLAWFAAITFVATTLLFPVATQWGTFLHAAGAIQVLLVLAALLGLDGLIDAIGRRRGWTRPVAWLGPALGIAAGILFTAALLPGFGRDGDLVARQYAALPAALEAAGVELPVAGGSALAAPGSPATQSATGAAPAQAAIITDFPIYLGEIDGLRALALPAESPSSVLDLARHFPGTSVVIVSASNDGPWPEIASTDPIGIRCFTPVALPRTDPSLTDVRVFRIGCP